MDRSKPDKTFVLHRIKTDAIDELPMFIRRLGALPGGTLACASGSNCPDILEMTNGDFAVIGADITAMSAQLPLGSGCGPTEKVVRIPRELLIRARTDIPATL